jgi:lysozyme family protein
MDFDSAFKMVIGHEGGYSFDRRDPGGETKYGISKRAFPFLDIKNLTLEHAKEIYRQDYWNRLKLDQMPECIRFDLFDAAVSSGVRGAAIMLQKACEVIPDGTIGPQTIQAANSMDPEQLDKRLSGQRLLFLTDLKTFPTYGRGWVKRVATNMIKD